MENQKEQLIINNLLEEVKKLTHEKNDILATAQINYKELEEVKRELQEVKSELEELKGKDKKGAK